MSQQARGKHSLRPRSFSLLSVLTEPFTWRVIGELAQAAPTQFVDLLPLINEQDRPAVLTHALIHLRERLKLDQFLAFLDTIDLSYLTECLEYRSTCIGLAFNAIAQRPELCQRAFLSTNAERRLAIIADSLTYLSNDGLTRRIPPIIDVIGLPMLVSLLGSREDRPLIGPIARTECERFASVVHDISAELRTTVLAEAIMYLRSRSASGQFIAICKGTEPTDLADALPLLLAKGHGLRMLDAIAQEAPYNLMLALRAQPDLLPSLLSQPDLSLGLAAWLRTMG